MQKSSGVQLLNQPITTGCHWMANTHKTLRIEGGYYLTRLNR